MRWFGLLLLLATLMFGANGEVMRLHEADYKMDWERAVEYCRSLDAYLPTLNMLKLAYKKDYRGDGGERPYRADSYWSADQFDIEGGYLFDFASGLHRVEYKGNRYRVMCIQIDNPNWTTK